MISAGGLLAIGEGEECHEAARARSLLDRALRRRHGREGKELLQRARPALRLRTRGRSHPGSLPGGQEERGRGRGSRGVLGAHVALWAALLRERAHRRVPRRGGDAPIGPAPSAAGPDERLADRSGKGTGSSRRSSRGSRRGRPKRATPRTSWRRRRRRGPALRACPSPRRRRRRSRRCGRRAGRS